MMRWALQRRDVLLAPASPRDKEWVRASLALPEIAQAFGYSLLSVPPSVSDHDWVGVLYRGVDRSRVGFVIVFPPVVSFPVWEVACAIPERKHRDGFTAIGGADAVTTYFLDMKKEPALGFRIRVKGRAAQALVRRLGYRSVARMRSAWGEEFDFYRIDHQIWSARKSRLGPTGIFQVIDEDHVPAEVRVLSCH